MKKEYYLGLDIGTNSVGWAVTDEQYQLTKYRRKDMWGIRLFEQANTAEKRRIGRATRRRLARRSERIKLLQMLFAEEISKVDPSFFIRLNESKLHMEDKSIKEKHPLFSDEGYSDLEYYKEYPTLFHLRKELIESTEKHDIRLVYLALHHILKNRGHFLVEGSIDSAKNFNSIFDTLVETMEGELGIDIDKSISGDFENILKEKTMLKSQKEKALTSLIDVTSEELSKEEIKKRKQAVGEMCKFVVGNKGNINKLFDTEFESAKETFKFSEKKYEEKIKDELEEALLDKFVLVETLKAIYDWSILVEILDDETFLSMAKVKQYEKHGKNLENLRGLIKSYGDKKTYDDFFNDTKSDTNYASYIGHVKKNGQKKAASESKGEEEFYKELRKILKNLQVEEKDSKIHEELLLGAISENLLPKQRSKDNGMIPNQVHKIELRKILKNADVYLPFLQEKDDKGITVSEKIESIFSFRIPYYVGPLSTRHEEKGANTWMVRKEEGRIYPWNFDEKVNREESNERFIKRMTNKCTYILGEDVIPKDSILYSQYMVLNELNNLKIRGKEITVAQKQEIYADLFLNHTKVTGKRLLEYLKQKDSELKKEDLSGFDENFKASLSTYLDFEKKVFGEKIAEDKVKNIIEDIVEWKTIYGSDNKMLKSMINSNYREEISEEQIKNIFKFKYTGWGNFSEKFLVGIQGVNKDTGEISNIIDALWNTNNNLMQILSKKFTFQEEIDKYNAQMTKEITEVSYDALVKDLFTSPKNKRAIWQTVQIVEEVKKIMGEAPKKIFVEMARETDTKQGKTVSRKNRLLELYKNCEEDVRKWTEEIEERDEREFNSMKLYLYYTQMGRCMYTGETIDIDSLMLSNSKWDKDHIYPQSKIKDDSIDNLVLVNKTVNSKKSNEMLSSEIQNQRKEWWKHLLKSNFISKKKYDRLTRGDDFSLDELSGFISRQLVETRQSSKIVKDLLSRVYTDTKVVPVKAGLVSQFRKSDLNMLKSRRVNDFHHAHDAYLNIVVGNVYSVKFTDNPRLWIKENKDRHYSINGVFNRNLTKDEKVVWEAPSKNEKGKLLTNDKGEKFGGTLDKIRKTLKQNNILHTEYVYSGKSELFDANPVKKSDKKLISLKEGLDTSKYGGYKGASTAYFALVEFDGKKGERVRQIVEVPIYVSNMVEHNANAIYQYFEEVKEMKNMKILREKIKKNSLMKINGLPLRIRGAKESQLEFKLNIQLCIESHLCEQIRKIEKFLEKGSDKKISEKFDGITDNLTLELYDILTDKLRGGSYSKRPANQLKILEEGREAFNNLNLEERAKVINEMLTMFRCDIATTANLKEIGGSVKAGNIAIGKNTVGKSKIILVNQSVTGLFENRIEL